MDPTYLHQPLSTQRCLRLLRLRPAQGFATPLRCTLEEVKLDAKPSFEALSYVWGDPEPKQLITIESGAGDKILYVTPNCAGALRRLRYRFQWRALWVDAICIDQTSLQDKAIQVPLMSEIYKTASEVLIWLGEPEGGHDAAKRVFDLAKRAGNLFSIGLLRTDAQHPANAVVKRCEKSLTSSVRELHRTIIMPIKRHNSTYTTNPAA